MHFRGVDGSAHGVLRRSHRQPRGVGEERKAVLPLRPAELAAHADLAGGGVEGDDGAPSTIAEFMGFPPTCLPIVRLLGGNHCCVDCGDENVRYGSVGYGTVLCAECATRHVTMSEEVREYLSLTKLSREAC